MFSKCLRPWGGTSDIIRIIEVAIVLTTIVGMEELRCGPMVEGMQSEVMLSL